MPRTIIQCHEREGSGVLFIPGAGDPRHPEGSGHLADYLARELGDGFEVVAPTMPEPDDPNYRPWRDAIEQHAARARATNRCWSATRSVDRSC